MKKYRFKKKKIEQAIQGLFRTRKGFERALKLVGAQMFDSTSYINIEVKAAESITGWPIILDIYKDEFVEVEK